MVLTITVGRTSTKSDQKLEEQDITETVEGVLGACHSEVVKGKEGNTDSKLCLYVNEAEHDMTKVAEDGMMNF